jgi:rod shape-determining protein MreD
MPRFLILLMTAYLLSLFQSAVISEIFPNFLKPDLMLIFITYLGASPFLITGMILSFACGLLMDTFSGSPFGLFLFIYLSIFFLLKLLGKILILGESTLIRLGLVALAIVFQLFLLLFIPRIFGIQENVSIPGAGWILPPAMATCVAAWPLFHLLKKLAALPGITIPQPMA